MIDRLFAHCGETALDKADSSEKSCNILKGLPIYVAGHNVSLVLRATLGKGTPQALQDLATL